MPLPVALSPRAPVPLSCAARYRTSVPHGDDLLFRFVFGEAYRHLLLSRIAEQDEHVVRTTIYFVFLGVLFSVCRINCIPRSLASEFVS